MFRSITIPRLLLLILSVSFFYLSKILFISNFLLDKSNFNDFTILDIIKGADLRSENDYLLSIDNTNLNKDELTLKPRQYSYLNRLITDIFGKHYINKRDLILKSSVYSSTDILFTSIFGKYSMPSMFQSYTFPRVIPSYSSIQKYFTVTFDTLSYKDTVTFKCEIVYKDLTLKFNNKTISVLNKLSLSREIVWIDLIINMCKVKWVSCITTGEYSNSMDLMSNKYYNSNMDLVPKNNYNFKIPCENTDDWDFIVNSSHSSSNNKIIDDIIKYSNKTINVFGLLAPADDPINSVYSEHLPIRVYFYGGEIADFSCIDDAHGSLCLDMPKDIFKTALETYPYDIKFSGYTVYNGFVRQYKDYISPPFLRTCAAIALEKRSISKTKTMEDFENEFSSSYANKKDVHPNVNSIVPDIQLIMPEPLYIGPSPGVAHHVIHIPYSKPNSVLQRHADHAKEIKIIEEMKIFGLDVRLKAAFLKEVNLQIKLNQHAQARAAFLADEERLASKRAARRFAAIEASTAKFEWVTAKDKRLLNIALTTGETDKLVEAKWNDACYYLKYWDLGHDEASIKQFILDSFESKRLEKASLEKERLESETGKGKNINRTLHPNYHGYNQGEAS
jgi:hypothetical protein